jgi:hypothetical protein
MDYLYSSLQSVTVRKNQKIASDFLIFYRSERIYFGGVSRRLTHDTASSLVFGGEVAELQPEFTLYRRR